MKMPPEVVRQNRSASDFTQLGDRILGSLATALIGDALGAPTEQRSIREIRSVFGGRVEDFYEPPTDSPYSTGRFAAQITDDSSQMLMLAQVFIDGNGVITPRGVADMVLAWSENLDYFPHFAGPSTRRAIEALRDGADPATIGAVGRETTMGTSNGGAMRVAPAGLIHPGDPEKAVRDAAISCQPSHFTSVGVSGAGAIAAAVATALRDDATILDVVRGAREGARLGTLIGEHSGRDSAGASVLARINIAVTIAMTSETLDEAVSAIADSVGSGLHAAEAIPAAIGCFVAAGGDPWLSVVAGANIGDDTDTVACMAGSIAGAYAGFEKVPRDKFEQVLLANNLDLTGVADGLLSLARITLDP